jgi:hypothetical protein
VAEIKSAIELAMERTKGLVMGEEEKKAAAEKELDGQVRAIARRYLEGIIETDDVTAEMSRLAGDKDRKRRLLIDAAAEEFDGVDENGRSFQLLQFAGHDLDEYPGREFEKVYRATVDDLHAMKRSVREEIVVSLESTGISGGAVEPNVPAWNEWRAGVDGVKARLKARILEWGKRSF